ncbi:hypothetical protein KAU88_01100 [Candidatus Bathyarchaeota archaeon]|nr:hypothetical protein [Candidatus Bathyarchaeota archaeon]
MVVENVADLLGFDIQFSWNTSYIKYITHTQTSTVESYPSPIPPSPCAGIIHDPPLRLAEVVDPALGSYWAAIATLGGSGFDGGGTVFVMAFRVVYQPEPGEGELNTRLDIQSANLASSGGSIPTMFSTELL